MLFLKTAQFCRNLLCQCRIPCVISFLKIYTFSITTLGQGSPVSSKAEKSCFFFFFFPTVFCAWKKQFLPVSSDEIRKKLKKKKRGKSVLVFSSLIHLRFLILSFIYGTKLLNYIKIGFQDMLHNNLYEPLGTYISCWIVISSFQHWQTTCNIVLLQVSKKSKVEISWSWR